MAELPSGDGIRPVGGTPAAPVVRRGERRRRGRDAPQQAPKEKDNAPTGDENTARKGQNIDERC